MKVPALCDVCKRPRKDTVIDGRTIWGYWAWMCPSCHKDFGLGLGTGKGQQFKLKTAEVWEKTGG